MGRNICDKAVVVVGLFRVSWVLVTGGVLLPVTVTGAVATSGVLESVVGYIKAEMSINSLFTLCSASSIFEARPRCLVSNVSRWDMAGKLTLLIEIAMIPMLSAILSHR